MNITKAENNEKMVMALTGRLDTLTAPNLEAEINALSDAITDLTLDMSALEYISSAGLRVLLSAQKKMNKVGKMVLTGVSESVREVFEITGFSEILNIE